MTGMSAQAADVICVTCAGAGDPRLGNSRFRKVLDAVDVLVLQMAVRHPQHSLAVQIHRAQLLCQAGRINPACVSE